MKKSKYDIRKTVEIEDLGKITATASALNRLSIALSESSKYDEWHGFITTAKLKRRQGRQIYEALKATGFYDD